MALGAAGCREPTLRRDALRRVDRRTGNGDAEPAARLGGDRRHHQLHQHLQPLGDDRRPGLLAKKAVERGLQRQALGQDQPRPGLAGGHRLPGARRPAASYLERCGFNLVGYGCTTCIGNSGPAARAESPTRSTRDDLVGRRGALGQPQLRGPHPPAGARQLPGLAAAGGRLRAGRHGRHRPHHRAARRRAPTASRSTCATSGRAPEEVERGDARSASTPSCSTASTAGIFDGDEHWRGAAGAGGRAIRLGRGLDLHPRAAVLRAADAPTSSRHRRRARAGAARRLGHHRPHLAGRLDPPRRPAGRYLIEHGVEPRDFNSYGARRGNHEVMVRGTFANIRLRNQLVAGVEGGFTRHLPDGEQMSIYDASHALPGGGRAAGRDRGQGVRLGQLARLGGQGHARCWACGP